MSSLLMVSNASPLIALEQLGHLDLLQSLIPNLVVPPAVADEVAPTVSLPPWIEVRPLSQPIGPLILAASLGQGESAAIGLALELQAERVILDERAARRLTRSLGVPVIGTLGLLAAARRKNLIREVKPLLDRLLEKGFRLAPALYESVLRDLGEA